MKELRVGVLGIPDEAGEGEDKEKGLIGYGFALGWAAAMESLLDLMREAASHAQEEGHDPKNAVVPVLAMAEWADDGMLSAPSLTITPQREGETAKETLQRSLGRHNRGEVDTDIPDEEKH